MEEHLLEDLLVDVFVWRQSARPRLKPIMDERGVADEEGECHAVRLDDDALVVHNHLVEAFG
eukprot:11795984-Heterocapsa_arctica.AAC.1